MADETTTKNGLDIGEGSPSPSSRKSRSRNSSTANTTSPGPGTGTGQPDTGTGETQENKIQGVPRQVSIDDIVPVPVPSGPKPRVRKPAQPKVNPELQELADNIKLFTMAAFSGLAAVHNPIWELRADEAENIAGPAARIMERLGALETTNAAADYIALTIGLAVIVVPRMVLIKSMQPEKVVKIHAAPGPTAPARNSPGPAEQSPSSPGLNDSNYYGPALA